MILNCKLLSVGVRPSVLINTKVYYMESLDKSLKTKARIGLSEVSWGLVQQQENELGASFQFVCTTYIRHQHVLYLVASKYLNFVELMSIANSKEQTYTYYQNLAVAR